MEQYSWINILPRLEARVLDTLLDDEGMMKVTIEVRSQTNQPEVTGLNFLTNEQTTQYEIIRSINQLQDLISTLPPDTYPDLELGSLQVHNDGGDNLADTNDDHLNLGFELSKLILKGLNQFHKDSILTTVITTFFALDHQPNTKSPQNKRLTIIQNTSPSWTNKLMNRLSQRSFASFDLTTIPTSDEPTTTTTIPIKPTTVLETNATTTTKPSLLRRLTQKSKREKSSIDNKRFSLGASPNTLLNRIGSYHHKDHPHDSTIDHNPHSPPLSPSKKGRTSLLMQNNPFTTEQFNISSNTPSSSQKTSPTPSSQSTESTKLNILNTIAPPMKLTRSPHTSPILPLSRSGTLRRKLTRSKSTKSHKESDPSIEITILFEDASISPLKLTVTKDITFDKLMRGIRSKAVLTGVSLPSSEFIQLNYYHRDDSIPLSNDNLTEFFTEINSDKTVLVSLKGDKQQPGINWTDITAQTNPRRKLSSSSFGLDLEFASTKSTIQSIPNDGSDPGSRGVEGRLLPQSKSKLVNRVEPRKELDSLDDFLRTPCETEINHMMKDDLWDLMPQLEFSLTSSSDSDSSPHSPSDVPTTHQPPLRRGLSVGPTKRNPTLVRRNTTATVRLRQPQPDPTSPDPDTADPHSTPLSLQRHHTTHGTTKGFFRKFSQFKSSSSNSSSTTTIMTPITRQPTRGGLSRHPSIVNNEHRLKVTVAINRELIVKLDLDTRSATYTSLRNRFSTKFSRAGYPLSKLNTMSLVPGHFAATPHLTTPDVIDDSHSLHRVMSKAQEDGHRNLTLLLIPNHLVSATPISARYGFQWDQPPNLVKVTRASPQPSPTMVAATVAH